ncbi:RuBisCO large subunit C-terminal-like domain-containing protein [Candidatus Margulisiibacteriota bacterium]
MDKFTVYYHLQCSGQEANQLARRIAVEQTVEMPEHLVTDPWIKDNIIGDIVSVTEIGPNCFEFQAQYHADITVYQLPQFLNLLFGNISMLTGIKLAQIEFPPQFLDQFQGPRLGVEGLRKQSGVLDRPLIATALKPLGSAPETLAEICYQFALGGMDIIKDDHSLSNQSFCTFKDRVSACMQAIRKAESETGKKTLYYPNVSGSVELLGGQIEQAIEFGAAGVVLHPFIMGLDLARHLIDRYAGQLSFMAHPSMSGALTQNSHGIDAAITLGTILRLTGFDISIFPHFGGRFPFSEEGCLDISAKCREKLSRLKPVFPAPAGGMNVQNIKKEAHVYGADVILLIGGSLYDLSPDLKANARWFSESLQ